MRFWVISHVARLRISVDLDYSLVHGPDLRCRLMPRPKLGRSRPPTAAAAPATSRLVHLQVIRHEQMAIAADIGYGHGLEGRFRRKGHDMSFGCFKSRPRYQCCITTTHKFRDLRQKLQGRLCGPSALPFDGFYRALCRIASRNFVTACLIGDVTVLLLVSPGSGSEVQGAMQSDAAGGRRPRAIRRSRHCGGECGDIVSPILQFAD